MSLGSSLLVPVSLTKGVQDLVEIVADNDSNLINTDESNTMSIKQFQSIFGAAGWHEDAQYSRGGHQWGRQGDAGVVWSGVGHGSGLGVGSYGSCQRVMYVSQSSDFLNSHWPGKGKEKIQFSSILTQAGRLVDQYLHAGAWKTRKLCVTTLWHTVTTLPPSIHTRPWWWWQWWWWWSC